jgi:hypothetical protein
MQTDKMRLEDWEMEESDVEYDDNRMINKKTIPVP